ncbi:GNAT family N-acetyltransferase [Chitinophaga oryzae]|uniref:GNAT family N-acetyltransferase n=1 Tax=Chitinophaga oryzae TaxID=2725414 RepID=A0AAE6ZIU6_9BACT|nr:GNAT family N-acetyltransferase [Chitinophaga oryzae]QJB32224.1 GNAT family N-acetyltransferase [Chitinophaga oryzae]QJB38686.1 GNAT family N-acetyltransferase [Chitinophaga oryzae]
MDGITIRKATADDLATILLIGRQTFFETFAPHNTATNMQRYLEESFSDEKVRGELNNPESFFFVATEGTKPVGYLKLNTGKAQTEAQDDTALEIERIYVSSDYHGKKVGQLLYEKALETALALGKSYLWLGVWEHNPRAIRFYEKNGFVAFSQHIFSMGEEEQTDIMMKKTLS